MDIALRRKQVFELANKGFTIKGISSKLGISAQTVSNDKYIWKKQQQEKEIKDIMAILSDIKEIISKLEILYK